MDYKDTLNLPKTEFSMRARLAAREPEQLARWEAINLYEYVQKHRSGAPLFVLHDGPPYANGNIHVGTALNKILKDFIVKYKTMRGYNVPFVPGWDMHGLPIEHQVTTQLGAKAQALSKTEIRRLCRDYGAKFMAVQRNQFKRLGVRGDWGKPYVTFDPEYEISVLDVLKKLIEKGSVYRSLKSVHWCPNCETALAQAEVEYEDHDSHSIYVKFPHSEIKERYFVIWTTTPWTLPANVAIVVHPDFEYSVVRVNEEEWVIASELLSSTMKDIGVPDFAVLDRLKGAELEGQKARHPYFDRDSVVVLGDYVTLEAGTGCVHTAPGHGEEDFQTGKKYDLPTISPVDERGVFTAEAGPYEGKHVFHANNIIIDDLEKNGTLLHSGKVVHSYPHCWRCRSPILFRATEQWFVSIDNADLRKRALAEVERSRWVPAWGQRRMRAMIEGRPDWCISRQRAWGVPIPAFKCDSCGEVIMTEDIIDKFADIVREFGTDRWFELDEIDLLPQGTKCPDCGKDSFKKLYDILDVWVESGASYEAVLKKHPELAFPSDVYIEGSDQHRGWFNSALLLSVATDEQAPFRTVITHGYVNDEKGRKMSKSLGNVVDPQEINEKMGAEIIRLWAASTNYQEDLRCSTGIISQQVENYRKIRNTFRYLLGNLFDYSAEAAVPYSGMTEIDKWAMMRLHRLIKQVTGHFEDFEFYRIHHLILRFVINDMSSFYLDIIKDRLYVEAPDSNIRRSAQTVLYETLTVLSRMLAPILTFTSEEVYMNTPVSGKRFKTIQLEQWPPYDEQYIDGLLESKWQKLLELREDVLKALENSRNEKLIGNSLDARVIVEVKNEGLLEILNGYPEEFISDLFIVSQAAFGPGEASYEGRLANVTVKKANGDKCSRCWKYSPLTGSNSRYPDICPRCASVLEELDAMKSRDT